MCRYLQRDLWGPARLGLRVGGVLIVIALLGDADSGDSGAPRFRVRPGELAKSFAGLTDWTILHQREGAVREHRVAEIVVRREEIPLK